ncbi:MAG: glycosyltransferase family 2 protein, partial [Planctomycetota bacterium]
NAGIEACAQDDHDRFVFLDADDTVEPGYATELSRALDASDDHASHAYCQERIVVPDADDFIWRTPDWDPDLLLLTNLHPVTALVRRAAIERVGLFDASFREGYEDWELWVRLALAGYHGVRVEAPLFVWRRRGGAESLVESAVKRHDELFARIVDKHRAQYLERAEALLKCWNHITRASDTNWLDADHQPVSAAGVAKHISNLETWLRTAQDAYAAEQRAHAETHARSHARIAELEAELDRLRSVRGASRTLASRLRARLGWR